MKIRRPIIFEEGTWLALKQLAGEKNAASSKLRPHTAGSLVREASIALLKREGKLKKKD